MRHLILPLFKLKLKILFNFTLNCINKTLEVIKIFLKKSFKINIKQSFYLVSIFILVLVETNMQITKIIVNTIQFNLMILAIFK